MRPERDMNAPSRSGDHPLAVPKGCALVPLRTCDPEGVLRLCVVFRTDPDPAAGHFINLRSLLTGRVLLGCFADAAGAVREWVELWIQDVDELAGAPDASRDALTNAAIDDAWAETFAAADAIDDGTIVRTGWETTPAPPIYLDPDLLDVVLPVHQASGHALHLCRDDGALTSRGLPAYGSSRHRYLHAPELGAESPFVAVTTDAPPNDATSTLAEVTGRDHPLVPITPGGLVHARRYTPVSYEALVEVLGGERWSGVFHGTTPLNIGEPLRGLSQASATERLAQGHLVLSQKSGRGRLVEIFHLKIRMLLDAVESVRRFVRHTQRPLLNLRPESFAVHLGELGLGLPYLWTARTVLVDPGEAVPLPIEGTTLEYYLPGRGRTASVFLPASGAQASRGECTVRIRQTMPEGDSALIVEGTLESSERLLAGRDDLVWLRLQTASSAVNLYAQLDPEQAMASRELRLRTVPQRFPADVQRELKQLEGIPIERVPFEVVPLMTTPVDLYALGALGVRTLLSGADFALPVALDEVLSLARQIAEDHEDGVSLGVRIQAILHGDRRWIESLGPHRLVKDEMTPEEGLDSIPLEMWAQALAMLVRAFPGLGPDSECRELGDAVPGGLQKVFDRMQSDLEDLALRSRSLIVVDWTANREIHAAIRRCATGMTELYANP